MARQDVKVELFYGGAWHNLVTDDLVLAGAPIVIMRGDSAESSAPRPSSVSLRLDNTDDRFRTSNPVSPLYGKAGVNTPLRISVGDSVRSYTGASSWKADQDPGFRRSPKRGGAWVDVQGGGPLQRVNQWSNHTASPLRQYDDANLTDVIGRWPLEDQPGATAPAGLVPGTSVNGGTEVALGSQIRAPGTEPLADIGGPNAGLAFNMAASSPTATAWQFSVVQRLPNLDSGTFPFLFDLTLADTTDVVVSLDTDNSLISFLAQTNTGTELGFAEGNIGADLTAVRLWVLRFVQNGTSIDVTLLWRAVGDDVWSSVTDSYTATVSPLIKAAFFGGDLPQGTTIGHVTAVASATPDLSSTGRYNAFAGHPGERASYRFGRLCDENNIPYYVSVGFDASQQMGAQAPDTLAGQFKEIAATEDALIFDYRTELRVYMLSRADRYNQTPALTLNADDDPSGMPSLPAETTDELPIHNLVTAKQRGGGDYTAEDSTSPMGTQDPPDGRGEYRQDIDVNVYDPAHDLRQQAYWWLNRGTVDLPRFPKVTMNLAVLDADKLAEVEAVDVGSVIEIVNYRENTIRLYVLGYRETIGTHSRMIEFTCFPDQQFQVGVYGGTDDYTPRYDLATCTLDGDHTATDTTLALGITGDEAWSTTGEPYDLMISGERVTVTSMGARTGSAGAYSQTATVIRSGNGVVKTLPDGSPVHIATPGRWAL